MINVFINNQWAGNTDESIGTLSNRVPSLDMSQENKITLEESGRYEQNVYIIQKPYVAQNGTQQTGTYFYPEMRMSVSPIIYLPLIALGGLLAYKLGKHLAKR